MDTLVMDPWSTHLPILRTLGAGVKRVLELGAGRYSTPLFLDRSVYPDVERVDSIEHDMAWASEVLRLCNDDQRLNLYNVAEPIEDFIGDLSGFDLIFVDNSDKPERRVATIEWVARHATTQTVVLHDLERDDYRAAAEGFKHLTVYNEYTPWTGVARNA